MDSENGRCRICLAEESTATLIALTQTSVYMLKSIYPALTIFDANNIKNHRLSFNYMCPMCQSILTLLYEFKQKVIRSESELLKYTEPLMMNNELTSTDEQDNRFDPIAITNVFSLNENVAPFDAATVKFEPEYEMTPNVPQLDTMNTICGEKLLENKNKKARFKQAVNFLKNAPYQSKEYICSICDLAIEGKLNAVGHVRYEHLDKGIDLYQCDHCGYKTPRKFNLQTHMQRHSSRGDSLSEISVSKHVNHFNKKTLELKSATVSEGTNPILSKQLKYVEYLNDFTKDKRFSCKLCQKQCSTQQNILLHIKEIHFRDSMAMYNCKFCSFSSTRKFNLKVHLKKHRNQQFCTKSL